MTQHNFESDIICPYCDYQIEDTCDYLAGNGGGNSFEVECPECEREFHCTPDYEVTFSTRRVRCKGESHIWSEASHSDIMQEASAIKNKDFKPHRVWIRCCTECEILDYKNAPLNSENPWQEKPNAE